MEYADSLGFDPVVVECDTAVADYDGDGMAAIIEARLGTDPRLADSDGDGIDDYWEVIAGLDPLVDDAAEDPDGDGRTNLEEYQNSGYFYTNPLNPDTDGDGLCDGVTSVMSGETVLCGPGEGDSATPELDAARLRLLAESAIGELTLGDGDTWADELEEGDTLKLSVAGALDAGTYTVRFDNGSGSVYAIEVAVSEGAIYILVDTGDLGDEASGNFDIDVVDDSGSSLLDSGAASVNISRRLYLHYGLHSPVVATNSDGETVWRRAYLPFGSDFAGSPSHPLTITNSSITHGFVGRRQDNDVGLYQLGARWYDPDLGRFVSVEPIPGFLNQYAYAGNNPFVYQDDSGMYIETAIDIGFISYDIYELQKDPSSGWNWAALGADALCAALPVVTGGGAAVHAIGGLNKAADAVQAADKLIDAGKAVDKGIDAARGVDKGIDAAKVGSEVASHADEAVDAAKGYERLAGSNVNHINGAIAEQHGWQRALQDGHIGIKPPGKVTSKGPDFITYSRKDDLIMVWDAKFRSGGNFPSSISASKMNKWMPYVEDAIKNMPAGEAKTWAERALKNGNIRGKLFPWP